MKRCAHALRPVSACGGLALAVLLLSGCSTVPPTTVPPTTVATPAAPIAGTVAAPLPAGGLTCDDPTDCKQLMLSFAYAADLSQSLIGDLATVTQTTKERIDCLLAATPEFEGWSTTWGPAIQLEPLVGRGADSPNPLWFLTETPANTMVVFSRAGSNDHVVAIAGTNPLSLYGWLVEDFKITPEAWPFGTGDSGYITKGTLDGLEILIALEDGSTSLAKYLATVTGSPGVTVYVTGHSLGGALSPALGLWLADTQGQASGWDPGSNASLAVYPFAGATPGDQHFAAYLNGKLPGDALVVVNNTNDVVPHAWNPTSLAQIQTLYPVGIRPVLLAPLVKDMEKLAVEKSADFDRDHPGYGFTYTTVGTAGQQQPVTAPIVPADELGNVHDCVLVDQLQDALLAATEDGKLDLDPSDRAFLLEMGYQHVCGYPVTLGLPDLVATMHACSADPPTAGSGAAAR